MPDATPKAYQCRHILADGHRCGSKALRNETFCYYHHATRKPAPRPTPPSAPEAAFDLPLPEDRASIQLCIGDILRRIAANQIDPRRAGLLLYGLQIASSNLPKPIRNTRRREEQPDPVEEIEVDPDLGPLAPVTEYEDYPEIPGRGRFVGDLLRELEEAEMTVPTIQAAASSHPGTIKSGPNSFARRTFGLPGGEGANPLRHHPPAPRPTSPTITSEPDRPRESSPCPPRQTSKPLLN